MTKTDWPTEPLTTGAMETLHRILRDWCCEHNCERSSERGQATARMLVDWFEFGVRDEGELAALLRDQLVLAGTQSR